MLNRKSILATVLSLALTGCSVGPRYKQPTLVLPQQFTAPNPATADVTPPAEASDPEFWHSFNDAELSSLVQRALTANNDLRVALAHYDSANALLREAKFDRYPTATMSTSVGRQKFSAPQAFGFPRNNRFFTRKSMRVGNSISLVAFATTLRHNGSGLLRMQVTLPRCRSPWWEKLRALI